MVGGEGLKIRGLDDVSKKGSRFKSYFHEILLQTCIDASCTIRPGTCIKKKADLILNVMLTLTKGEC